MKMRKSISVMWMAVGLMLATAASQAQEATHPALDHSQMDHSKMDHGQMDHNKMPSDAATPARDEHAGHGGARGHASMQGGPPPPDARDPHAYSGGQDFGPYKLHLMDRHRFYSVLADRFEIAHNRDQTSLQYDVQAWTGTTYNRLVLKAEGHADSGRLEEARTELLWGHAVAAYWDTQLGVRADHGEGPDRNWLGFGVQGVAPYWFEIDATAYVGEQGRTALRLEAEYELLLTQRLVLQPRVEANWYGKRDEERGIGPGLSDAVAGIRLRYEFRREFAPYIGVEWAAKYGTTADYTRAAGDDTRETRFVAGLRFWY